MKVTLSILILMALAISAHAQTFIGGGLSVIRSSSYDPSPMRRNDGGKTYPGVYVEGGYQFPGGLQARFLGEYNSDVALRSIFTSDTPIGKKTGGEFRFRPELRLRPGCKESGFCLFLAGGADYYRQRMSQMSHGEREYAEPAAGLNPFFTVGAEFGKAHEVSFSRLFTDKTALNDSQLHGYRGEYSYTRPLAGHLHFKVAGEVDYVIYRDSIGEYVASYEKRDAMVKIRVGFIIK